MPPKATLKIPQEFICPITKEIMIDPVTVADDETYDRDAIERWLQSGGITLISMRSLKPANLIPNQIMKQKIRIFVEENKHFFHEKLIEVINETDEWEEEKKWQYIWKLIGLGINLADVHDAQGWSLLHYATYRNYKDMVLTLIDNNCDLGKNTAIFQARVAPSRVLGDECREALAVFFPTDNQHICITQCTPLLLAVYCGHLEIVKRFLAEKPDLNQVDEQGCTYLHWAAFCGNKDILTELLKHDVDCQLRNKQGKSAIDFARLFGFKEGVALLEKKMESEGLLAVSASGAALQEAAIAGEDIVEGPAAESSRSVTPLGCFSDAGGGYPYAFGQRREAVIYFDDPVSLDQMRFALLLLYIQVGEEAQIDSLLLSYPGLLDNVDQSGLCAQKAADLKARLGLGGAMQPPTTTLHP